MIKVRAYQRDVLPGRIGGLKTVSEDRGLYRLRSANSTPYAGVHAFSQQENFVDKIAAGFVAATRLAIASAVLTAWLVAVYLYRDTPVDLSGLGAGWLTLAHLLVPAGFFLVFLTNRRYGAGYAFLQVVVTFALAATFVVFTRDGLIALIPIQSVPPLREVLAFGGAFVAACLIANVAFDGARGPRWWTAPLIGFLAASIVFATVLFAGLFAGTGAVWLGNCLAYLGLIAGEGILLLIPFWALRGMVPPMSGFGGY